MTAAAAPIRIFRPGTFTSVEGIEVSFGAAELAAIAAAYDPSSDPAPLVVGHPRLDDPAWGWVGSLAVEDDVLVAYPERIEPAFAETVREGRYAKVSAQFYPPDSPANPSPGAWYLKHIGFLGAHAPGVKGLGTVSMAAAAADTVTIDFSKPALPAAKETNVTEAIKDPAAAEAASFAERQATLDAREAALAAREKAVADAASKAAHEANVSFAEGLTAAGKLGKAGADLLVIALDGLTDKVDAVSFGEASEAITPAAALRKLFGGASPLVSLGEAAPADESVSQDPHDLARAAASFAEEEMAAGRPTTIAQAVRHVQAQGSRK